MQASTGDFVVQLEYAEQSVELEAENWRPCSATVVRGVSGELEAENWRPCSTTLVRGVSGELEESPTRVSQQCPARVSHKSVP